MGTKKRRRGTKPPSKFVSSQDRAQSVPRHEQQYALVGGTLLDIEHAHRLLRAAPRATERIDVEAWGCMYGLDGNPHSPVGLGPQFDPVHARTVDLTRPLILGTFATGPSRDLDFLLIIDGSHRLFRAFTEARDSLPAHVLTATETRAITVVHPLQNGATTWYPSRRTPTADRSAMPSTPS